MFDPAVRRALREFVEERDWARYHTPQNLAKSISIEAGELLEQYQWNESPNVGEVVAELADVLTYCLLLADRLQVDPDQVVLDKLAVTRGKYPVEKARGKSTRHDRL